MARIAIFASGNGSNFEAITKGFAGDLDNQVALLICDKEKAFVLERAKKLNIHYELVRYENGDREKAEKQFIELFKKYKINVVFLAGFMKVLTKFFFKNINIPVINIHPALLPKYKGINAIERAFASDDNEIGITIHYVNEEVDSGEIILQKNIPLNRDKGLEIVEQEVHNLEHEWYPITAKQICNEINNKKGPKIDY